MNTPLEVILQIDSLHEHIWLCQPHGVLIRVPMLDAGDTTSRGGCGREKGEEPSNLADGLLTSDPSDSTGCGVL